MFEVFKFGQKYTIAKRKYNKFIVNDGVCGYYVWDTKKEAEIACRMIKKADIDELILFDNEDDKKYFDKAKTDGTDFVCYLLLRNGIR